MQQTEQKIAFSNFTQLCELANDIEELKSIETAAAEKNYNVQIAKLTHTEQFKDFVKLHPSEQAIIVELAFVEKQIAFANLCLLYVNALFLAHLSIYGLESLLKKVGDKCFISLLTKLDVDDAVSVLEEFDVEDRLKIISAAPSDYRAQYKRLLSYPEESVGRVMDTNFITQNYNVTAKQVIDEIRQHQNEDGLNISSSIAEIVIVLDDESNFYGVILLSKLVKLAENEPIKKYVDKTIKILNVKDSQRYASKLFMQYDYTAMPVANKLGKIVGVLDDSALVDYLQNENNEVILKSRGIFDISKINYKNAIQGMHYRFGWLLVNLITAILSSFFISLFESSIAQLAPLAVLMPIVASIGGNSGMQTSTIVVRFLSSGTIKGFHKQYFKYEMIIACLNCIAFGIVSFGIAWFWYKNIALCFAFSLSIMFVIICAVISGFFIPCILDKIKIDPAIASSIFLTTVTDIVGFSGFLLLSKHFVL